MLGAKNFENAEKAELRERREHYLEGNQATPSLISLSFKFSFSFAIFSKVTCHLANVMKGTSSLLSLLQFPTLKLLHDV